MSAGFSVKGKTDILIVMAFGKKVSFSRIIEKNGGIAINKLKFSNRAELEVISVIGQTMYFQGIERNTLEIFIPVYDKTFEEIDRLFQLANLKTITIIEENGQYQYNDYVLRVSLSLKPVMFQADTEIKTENQFVVMIAQQDKLFSRLNKMLDTIDMQNEILADVIGGAY